IGLDTHTAISTIGLAGLFVASLNIFYDFKTIKYKDLCKMLIGSLLGIPIGIWCLRHFEAVNVQFMLVIFLFIYGIYPLERTHYVKNYDHIILKAKIWSFITGIVSGVLGSLYNSRGVRVVISGTMTRWGIKAFRSTVQADFLITAIFVVVGQ